MQELKSIKRENSKKEKLKAHSGITLIALVITIIVLLILAGVALSMLTGDSGILSNAEKAKEQTNLANSKEQVALAVTGALTEGLGTITRDNLKDELDNIVGTENEDYTLSDGNAPWEVTVGDYKVEISANGSIKKARDTETLAGILTTEGTTPWLPEGFSRVTEFTEGIVISNTTNGTAGTQNYVWIEVPTTISGSVIRNGTTTTVTLEDAKTDSEIYTILEAYAGDYIKGKSNQDRGSCKEEWFDKYSATWDGTSTYAYIANKGSDNFSKWKDYYGENNVYTSTSNDVTGTMTPVNFGTATYNDSLYYFVKVDDNFKNREDGCGLTYDDYRTSYSNMLNSIKKNGGFWLAQYEAGIAYEEEGATATNRTETSSRITTFTSANYAKDQYPYNYVYCSEAQKIANVDSTTEYTSSLPFGIQWDLVCKFLEVKTELEYADIATVSLWGNYFGSRYTPSSTAKYSTNRGALFTPVLAENGTAYEKTAYGEVLLTTGAIEEITASMYVTMTENADASPMNIYDFAGNVSEYTLENHKDRGNGVECGVTRGGSYIEEGGGWDYPASFRSIGRGSTRKPWFPQCALLMKNCSL